MISPIIIASLRVPPNSIVSGVFEDANYTAEVLFNEAKAYAILDLTSMIIYDDVQLLFTVENYTGSGSLFLSSQVELFNGFDNRLFEFKIHSSNVWMVLFHCTTRFLAMLLFISYEELYI